MVSFKSLLSTLFVTAAWAIPQATTPSTPPTAIPPPPALTHLYTSYVNISNPVDYGIGPYGDRLVIPIVGGNFTGKISGTILDLGADWGLLTTTPEGTTFHPDTRYGFQTHDGAFIYVRSQGSSTLTGGLLLRFEYETGSPAYFYLNNIVAIGLGSTAGNYSGGSILRIDTWYF